MHFVWVYILLAHCDSKPFLLPPFSRRKSWPGLHRNVTSTCRKTPCLAHRVEKISDLIFSRRTTLGVPKKIYQSPDLAEIFPTTQILLPLASQVSRKLDLKFYRTWCPSKGFLRHLSHSFDASDSGRAISATCFATSCTWQLLDKGQDRYGHFITDSQSSDAAIRIC